MTYIASIHVADNAKSGLPFCKTSIGYIKNLSGNYLLFMKTSDLQVKRDIPDTNIQ